MLYTNYLDNFVQRNTLNPNQLHSGNIGDAIAPGTVSMSQTNFSYVQDWVTPSGLVGVDFITDKLDAEAGYIKGDFTFTESGSISISTDANNGLWISPNGILGKKSGANTFTITNQGDATFGGSLSAASGTINNITATNITINSGTISWSDIDAPTYNDIGGTKPPSDADNTYDTIGSDRLTYITSTGVYSGTITGNIVQTSATANTGVKMGDYYNGLNVYGQTLKFYSGSSLQGWLYADGAMKLYSASGRNLSLSAGSGTIYMECTAIPSTNSSFNLGSSSYLWGNVFTQNIDFGNSCYISRNGSVAAFNNFTNLSIGGYAFRPVGFTFKDGSGNNKYLIVLATANPV